LQSLHAELVGEAPPNQQGKHGTDAERQCHVPGIAPFKAAEETPLNETSAITASDVA
jgi:hypothetical protein